MNYEATVLEDITITANGRQLTFTGTHDTYLKWYSGWDAGIGSVYKAAKDIPQGSLCIDAGANIGIMAIRFAVQRPDCYIIAIEPVPDNAECLRHNVKTNSIANVEVIEAAVSDRHGVLPMTNNGPWSSVWDGSPLQVRAIILDDFIDRKVAFVKIDTEGYEPHVFAGARRLFAKYKPLIHVEFNTWFLLLHHYDPIEFAKAIWSSCEVLGMYHSENFLPPPADALGIVHDNIAAHGSITDLLLRPRSEIPELGAMIYAPETRALRRSLGHT
jgi:FkbM family methyltransferase